MSEAYVEKMRTTYEKRRKPGMPRFEKVASSGKQPSETSWTFRDGRIVARQGDVIQEKAFRVKRTTAAGIVIEVSDATAGPIEMELNRTGQDELQVRFPKSEDVPPLLLVRKHG